MTLPNPCCCGECCLLADDFTGADVVPEWNVVSGSLTLDTGTNIATITGGSVISADATLPGGSGRLSLYFDFTTDTTSIKFCYADSSNHWRLDCTVETFPYDGSGDSIHFELFQILGGSEEAIGDSWVPGITSRFVWFCWTEGGRVHVSDVANDPTTSLPGTCVFIWPNGVTGGNTFRIEPAGDVDMRNVGEFCRNAVAPPDFVVASGCYCAQIDTCMFCPDGEWGDSIEVEVLTGTYIGTILTLDRYRTASATRYAGLVSYWHWQNNGNGVLNHFASIGTDGFAACADDTFYLQVDPPDAAIDETAQTVSDCDSETTWDITVPDVTGEDYRVTLL